MPGVTTAADSRQLYVGDPAQVNTPPTPYEVHPTAVSPGNVSYFDVMIKNKGRQTLTNASIAMGTLIATNDGNGNVGNPLPSGWKIKNVTSLSGISPSCVTDPTSTAPETGLITPGAYDGFNCGFGNLARNASGTIRVYLTAGPSLASSSAIQVSGKVAENVGGNVGGNTNTYYAYGAGRFFFGSDGEIAGLFSPQSLTPAKHVAGAPNTTVDITLLTGEYVVSIQEQTSSGPDVPACPATVTCLGGASIVHVNFGNSVSPYFVWTMLFPVSSSYKLTKNSGFIHFFDDGSSKTFYNVSQTSCFKPHATQPCADFELVVDTFGNTFVEVRFETNINGSGRAF